VTSFAVLYYLLFGTIFYGVLEANYVSNVVRNYKIYKPYLFIYMWMNDSELLKYVYVHLEQLFFTDNTTIGK